MPRLKRLIYQVSDKVAEISLSKGTTAILDALDIDKCINIGWALKEWAGRQYVHGSIGRRGYKKTIMMHVYLMQPPKGFTVDHINGNGLDNRRVNLRLATPQQNAYNRRKIKQKTSKYKGVHRRENGKWRAAIRFNRKLINLGTFTSEEEAAKVYNEAALKYFGEFACLNLLAS